MSRDSVLSGNSDHELHWVDVLVTEGVPYDLHSVLMGHGLQRHTVHRHQLKTSLRHREQACELCSIS